MTTTDTVLRQWHMLRLVPRYPQKISVQAIKGALEVQGFDTTERTIQRDLVELSRAFPLVVDERAKPFGWSWQRDAHSFDLPGLTVSEALTWVLAEQHLQKLLPAAIVEHLQPQFLAAHRRLEAEPQPQRGRSWLDKVRTVPPAQPLIPPTVDADVQRVVSDALMRERQLEITYRKKGSKGTEVYRIHPLALIQRGWVIYLYARISDYSDARNLALHRVESAKLLDANAVPPPGYDLDDRVTKGVWGFGPGTMTSIELRFTRDAGEHLLETPLSADQAAMEEGDSIRIRATVSDNPQLRWWLRGFGDGVEVVAPESLRDEMLTVATRTFEKYRPFGDASG